MSGNHAPFSLEQQGRAARQTYMSYGANVPLGAINLLELQTCVTATEPVRWEPHEAQDIGWLCLETVIAQTYGPDRNQDSARKAAQYDSVALMERAADYWKSTALNSASSPLVRSQATLAVGALAPYALLVHLEESSATRDYYKAEINAAGILLKAYERFLDPELLHDLHAQTAMLLFNGYEQNTGDLMLPLPTRFREQGNDRSADVLLWKHSEDGHAKIYEMRVSPHEGGALAGNINIWPALFDNGGYAAASKQGTTQALVDQFHHAKTRLHTQRKRHLRTTRAAVWKAVQDQTAKGLQPAFEIDPMSGLAAAREWYGGLRPNYRFDETDKWNLEKCINPFENALGYIVDGKRRVGDLEAASHEDLHMFGWLWMELNLLTGEEGGFGRAEQAFNATAAAAEVQQNWPAYCEAEIDATTARLYQGLQTPEAQPTALATYHQELLALAQRMLNGFETVGEDSPQYLQLRAIGQRLAACLAIGSESEDYLAVMASPRQRGVQGHSVGADILVIPQIDERYSQHTSGKVRFSETDNIASLDEGIATVAFRTLYGSGPIDVRALLHTAITASSPESSGDASSPELVFIEYLREQLIASASTAML